MAITPKNTSDTSNDYYKVGIAVSIKNNSASYKQCTVTVTPCLCRKKNNETRYRHSWDVLFSKDHVYYKKFENEILPNDNSQAGVVSAGVLKMKEGTYYQWGPSYDITFDNDGSLHSVGIYLRCNSTSPRYCPARDTYLEYSFQTEKYMIVPPKPTGLRATFDETTRQISYYFDPIDCDHVLLWRNHYDDQGNIIKNGYFLINGSDELSYADVPLVETLSEDVSYVSYEACSVSVTGHSILSGSYYITIDTNRKVWIKTPDGWKKAIPWIKTPDGWKKANKVYVRTNGVWKQTIM